MTVDAGSGRLGLDGADDGAERSGRAAGVE
jgi:hypothetical protein